MALGSTFAFINHSWDHPILDGFSYADALLEFTRNDQYLRGLGLAVYASANAVTPNVSGLGNPNAMQALFDSGVRQIVSDSSQPGENNPSPNAGIPNASVPALLEIPRRPTELFFNVSQPVGVDHRVQRPAVAHRQLPRPHRLAERRDLLEYLLRGENDPWMFHQANTRDLGGGHSLLSDLLDAAFDKYAAVATFPIVSPTMDELADRVRDRMSLNASGVSATLAPGSLLTVKVTKAATVPVTGLCTPGAESYAGQTISYLKLAAGQSVTLSLADCNPTGGGGTGGSTGCGRLVGHRRLDGRERRRRRGHGAGARWLDRLDRRGGVGGCGRRARGHLGRERRRHRWR